MYYVIYPFNKKNIIFFPHFTWYQNHGRLELGFFHGSNSNNPSSGRIALRPPHLHLRNPISPLYHLSCWKIFQQTFPIIFSDNVVSSRRPSPFESPYLSIKGSTSDSSSTTCLHVHQTDLALLLTCWRMRACGTFFGHQTSLPSLLGATPPFHSLVFLVSSLQLTLFSIFLSNSHLFWVFSTFPWEFLTSQHCPQSHLTL